METPQMDVQKIFHQSPLCNSYATWYFINFIKSDTRTRDFLGISTQIVWYNALIARENVSFLTNFTLG